MKIKGLSEVGTVLSSVLEHMEEQTKLLKEQGILLKTLVGYAKTMAIYKDEKASEINKE